MTAPTLRVCLICHRLFTPSRGNASRCRTCDKGREQERNASRGWYKSPAYLAAKRQAATMWGAPCPVCLKTMTGGRRPTVDHITPIAKGGSWDGPFEIICYSCNSSKGANSDA